MVDNHFKMLYFLLRCVLFLQLIYSINHQFGAEATQPELNDRLTKVEAQNQRHENEISILKMEKVEDRKEIHKLRERVAHLEDSTFSKNGKSEEILERPKRPASLLPDDGKAKYDSKKGDTSLSKGFYGPPTNCKDLGRLGHTLNGFYLVKGKDESNNSKIKTVYCQFMQPQGRAKLDLETLIGNVEMKTKSVHFFVQKLPRNFVGAGHIRYVDELVNVGGAMNMNTGKFTAPVPGIYHFDFSAVILGSLNIYLLKNGIVVDYKYMGNLQDKLAASISASLKLKANDIVYVSVSGGSLFDGMKGYTKFAGWLVEEDLKFLA